MRFSVPRPGAGSRLWFVVLVVGSLAAPLSAEQELKDWAQRPGAGQTGASSHPGATSPSAGAADGLVRAHHFWDRTNILLFAGVAITRGMDYASTRNFQARGRDEILIPDDVVNNSAGFAALETAGTATSIGISYLFHRTGHHKLERWMSIGHISVTGFGDVRNYCLKTRRMQ